MDRDQPVPKPSRKTEFTIFFDNNRAAKGWANLRATRLSDLIQAWETLSSKPLTQTESAYPLKGELATIGYQNQTYSRWQLKLSGTTGARIWYFVVGRQVFIEAVHTSHPNQTK